MKQYKKFSAGGKYTGVLRNIAVNISIADIMSNAEEGMKRISDEVGMSVITAIMEGERQRLLEAGQGYRHGSQPGYVCLNGRKVAAESLRVRRHNGREVPLETYKAFQGEGELPRRAFADMIRNVSTRDYKAGVTGFMRSYGVSRSAVSRNFIVAAQERLQKLMERRIDAIDPVAILIDGKGFGDILLIVAIGIDIHGRKHTLGLWQGATESAAVCEGLLNDLIKRGLDPQKQYLFITDGSKALKKATGKVFGGLALTQRCQEHKKRNILEHLPDSLQPEFRGKLNAAYGMTEYEGAKSALYACVRELDRINPSAARSLEEGLEDTLTLHRLGVSETLRESLRTTNCIESAFSSVGYRTDRVKRWRNGAQTQRWAASALLFAEERWHRVRGWREMQNLRNALDRNKNMVAVNA